MVGEVPMPDTGKLDILLLCDYHARSAGTIIDHIRAFETFSRHRIWILSNLGDLPRRFDLSRFDGIIIHYSIVVSNNNFLSPRARTRIRRFEGLKAVYVQDDYRWIDRTVAAFRYLRINAVFGLPSQNIIDQVYSPAKLPGVRRETVLAGYVPEELTRLPVKPYENRRLDVGYRARRLPAWIGEHAQEKWRIAERFSADAKNYGIVVDISCREEDRIYGQGWIDFISDCKAVLGSESGSSVCDFSGEVQANVERHEREHPDTPFEVLRDLYFEDLDGKVIISVISPRCFEAAALRTLMILYEGDYSGIFKPWRHYVPLKKDHSNMDEVVAVLRDPQRAQQIIDTAYREVALNPQYSYKAMVEQFDRVLGEEFRPGMRRSERAYTPRSFAKIKKRAQSPLRWPRLKVRLYLLVYDFTFATIGNVVPFIRHDGLRRWLKRRYYEVKEMARRMSLLRRNVLHFLRILAHVFSLPLSLVLLKTISVRRNPWQKVRLLVESARLADLRAFVTRTDATEVIAIWDLEAGRLTLEGHVPDTIHIAGDTNLGLDQLTKDISRGALREMTWVNHDRWQLAPTPPLPGRINFSALAKAASAHPELVTSVIAPSSPNGRWIKHVVRIASTSEVPRGPNTLRTGAEAASSHGPIR